MADHGHAEANVEHRVDDTDRQEVVGVVPAGLNGTSNATDRHLMPKLDRAMAQQAQPRTADRRKNSGFSANSFLDDSDGEPGADLSVDPICPS